MLKTLVDGCTPTRGSKYSACIDLYSSKDVVIGAGETKLVGLGVCIDIGSIDWNQIIHNYPSLMGGMLEIAKREFLKSHYLQLMLRSSLGKKGLILPNGVGVIDLDYKDEIKMIIHNPIQGACEMGHYDTSFKISKGDKIAQITLLEHKSYLFGIESDVERSGGFGSSGAR